MQYCIRRLTLFFYNAPTHSTAGTAIGFSWWVVLLPVSRSETVTFPSLIGYLSSYPDKIITQLFFYNAPTHSTAGTAIGFSWWVVPTFGFSWWVVLLPVSRSETVTFPSLIGYISSYPDKIITHTKIVAHIIFLIKSFTVKYVTTIRKDTGGRCPVHHIV